MHRKTLKKILSKHDIVIPDTCVLGETNDYGKEGTLEERIEFMNRCMKSYSYWKEEFKADKGSKLFLTREVYNEVYPEKPKKIKKSKNPPREINQKIQNIYKRAKEMKKTAEKYNAIIDLKSKNKEIFKRLYDKYSSLKNQERPLGETDYSLLLSCMIHSLTNKTALISNDSGIKNAWKELLSKEKEFNENFNFYVRKDYDKYQKIFHKKY